METTFCNLGLHITGKGRSSAMLAPSGPAVMECFPDIRLPDERDISPEV